MRGEVEMSMETSFARRLFDELMARENLTEIEKEFRTWLALALDDYPKDAAGV